MERFAGSSVNWILEQVVSMRLIDHCCQSNDGITTT